MEKINFKNKLFVNFVAGAVVFLNICSMPVSMAMIEPPKSAPHQIVNYEYGLFVQLFCSMNEENVDRVSELLRSARACDINELDEVMDSTPLMHAVHVYSKDARVAIVKLMLEHGADVNVTSEFNHTALMNAACAYADNVEVVRMLIDAGADVNAQDVFGDSALGEAVKCGHTDIVRLLLEHGAVVNSRTSEGTILECARRKGNPEIIRMLVEHGAI